MFAGIRRALLGAVLAMLVQAHAALAGSAVVASIKPVHSLVAGVMQGVGTPHLIVKGTGSPHAYSLRPSDAVALERAALVFWVGDEMEVFLKSSITSLARNAVIVSLAEADGLTRLPLREGGVWVDHDDEGHAGDGDAEGPGETDMHLWLDPLNAKAMVTAIATALGTSDPANGSAYQANAAALLTRLDTLVARLESELATVKTRPYVMFHDSFQYLEKRFALNAAGAVTISPERRPGAARLRDIRRKIAELGAVCVFSEPQFNTALTATVISGTKARHGVLDPLGAGLTDGPELYFELMTRNAAALKTCLAKSG